LSEGRLLGRGRHADVFELDAGRVLRRYRTGQDAGPEAAVMEHVRRHGYPVPEVFAVDGCDLVMQRVDGPSMLDAMVSRPHRLFRYARTLAELHQALHRIPAPDDLDRPVGDGDAVLHLDLQPANVVMTAAGPVVLDWGWAAAGPSDADAAHTWLQLATSEVPGGRAVRAAAGLLRSMFVSRFLAEFERGALAAQMAPVAAYRLARRELTARERDAISVFAARVA